MPRMPMIAVAVATLLLLLTAKPALGRAAAAKTTATPPDVSTTGGVDETTSLVDFQSNTVTIEVDSDIILTTEDGVQMFTQPDYIMSTTEEPLPDSVVQQLERERAEREQHHQVNETTTAGNTVNPNHGQMLRATKPTTTATPAAATTTARKPDLATTTTTAIDGYYPTNAPYIEENPNTSGPLTYQVLQTGTDTISIDQVTWLGNLAELVESTTEIVDTIEQSTWLPDVTFQPTESKINSTTTQPIIDNTVKPLEYVDLLSMMDSNTVTEMVSMQPKISTTEEPKPELSTLSTHTMISTISDTDEMPETTIAAPKQQSMFETTWGTAATTSIPETTTFFETSTTSSPISSPTSSSSSSPTSSTSTHPTSSTTSITTSNPTSSTTSSTTSRPTSSTTSSTTTSTTAAPVPTRMARIERIFNPDGVEVLYGYSSVVRTNRN